jgi:uncharacterized protein
MSLSPRAGIGLRSQHYTAMLESLPDIGWLEVHGENYFCDGGQPLRVLERLRSHYPLSLHCVGLSLGSVDAVDAGHLKKLRSLTTRFDPSLVSDHLSWGQVDGAHFNDLLPLPYTEEALAVVCRNVEKTQDCLGRTILVENVSSYLRYRHSTIPEWQFIAEVSRRSGCGILLDVNNIYVNAMNHGIDAGEYLAGLPVEAVQEIHLAGFEVTETCLIDTHSRPVHAAVWRLFADALRRFGPRPTLIEWDTDIPPLATLLDEAVTADRALLEAEHVAVAA